VLKFLKRAKAKITVPKIIKAYHYEDYDSYEIELI